MTFVLLWVWILVTEPRRRTVRVPDWLAGLVLLAALSEVVLLYTWVQG